MSANETMTIETNVTCRVLAGKDEGGKPTFEDIPRGTRTTLPVKQAIDLIRMKAAVAVDEPEDADPPHQDDDPGEEERLRILEEARKLGIKGLRKDSSIETIRAKLDAIKTDNDADDGDVQPGGAAADVL